jgi:hypothetical protein
MSGPGFIAEESPQACELCGLIDECRPYGPRGEEICFKCAMSTPEMEAVARKQMERYIFRSSEQ